MRPKSKVPVFDCYRGKVGQYNGLTVAFLAPFPSDLPACLGGSLPLLVAGDWNAKHMD